jgi:hypothetical protein
MAAGGGVMYVGKASVGAPVTLAYPEVRFENHVTDFFRIGGVSVWRLEEDHRVLVGFLQAVQNVPNFHGCFSFF